MKAPQNDKKENDLKLPLTFIISLFLHLVIVATFLVPFFNELLGSEDFREKSSGFAGNRDIIVNINQDDRKVYVRETLLSDRDSSASGYITTKKGRRWLNNSLDFRVKKGKSGKTARRIKVKDKKKPILLADESEIVVLLERKDEEKIGNTGQTGVKDEFKIPDKDDIKPENSLYFSNDMRFSFNTAKFKHFKYFKQMKDKVYSNWHPPIMANAVIYGYDPLTGGYAPGRTRIMAIPGQTVIGYFVMDKNGEVKEIVILESLRTKSLDRSIIDAFRISKNFGKVPSELLKGQNRLAVPFIFKYFVY